MIDDCFLPVQEEVMSARYKRIVFYNITAKPVREEFTMGHMFKGQLNMLNLLPTKF